MGLAVRLDDGYLHLYHISIDYRFIDDYGVLISQSSENIAEELICIQMADFDISAPIPDIYHLCIGFAGRY
jgi:hypothetical protein